MIKLANVSKQYKGVAAVDDISFEVKEGETVVLLGTSGCGKTTTLRMINRLTEPTSGSIYVNGNDIKQQSAETLRRGIGYVLQHHGLFPHYTVEENIATVPNLLKWDKSKTKKRAFELLEKLRLPPSIAETYPTELSGGQQQRVGLARALAAYPPVLLMDEPLGALDPITRADIQGEFKNLDELKRKTILMVTHDVQEAFQLGDRVCLMDKGKIVQIGSASDLLFHPASDFVTSFLKQHHFQLELETIFLKDVWSFLPRAIDGTDENFLNPQQSLWKAIEEMSLAPSSQRFVSFIGHDKKQLNVSYLMSAYTQYKNSLKDE
jgi:osmoprotectant transport system ATP-binding protein